MTLELATVIESAFDSSDPDFLQDEKVRFLGVTDGVRSWKVCGSCSLIDTQEDDDAETGFRYEASLYECDGLIAGLLGFSGYYIKFKTIFWTQNFGEGKEQKPPSDVFRSTDAGQSWTKVKKLPALQIAKCGSWSFP